MLIITEEDIINFIKKYGMLGRRFLDKRNVEESVEWFLAHVNAVKICAKLSLLINECDYKKTFH